VKVQVAPNPKVQRVHSSFVQGESNWVGASLLGNVERITLSIPKAKGDKVQLRLVFMEPEEIAKGERVFDVEVQGQPVLTGFDIVAQAKGHRRTIARTFDAKVAGGKVVIEFKRLGRRPAIISGLELQ